MTNSLRILLTIIFVVSSSALSPLQAQFAGGNGSAEAPWQIESPTQLLNIDDHLDGYFIQTGHIDMAGISFTAIGSPSNPFTGYYDGAHYEIRNMSISEPEMNEQALFRAAEEAVFRNMIFTDASVEGSRRVGILVGVAEGIIFENISVSGEVISHGSTGMNWSEAGGMAGSIRGGIVRHCIADVVVTGHRTVGGLIGSFTNSAEIYQSASYGQISGQGSNSGGLIGLMGGTGVITDSYSHANVEGDNTVGGLIGNFSAQGGRIQNCLSTGRVTGTGDDVGGLLGSVFSATRMNISHCFWNASASDITASAGGAGVKGLSMTELMQRETYNGFNFHSLWQIDDGNSYPSFQDLSDYEIPEPASIDELQGDGTADEPWLISSPSELLAIADNVHGHYRLTADIDLESSAIWNYGRGWTPLGGINEGEHFTGVLDGDGHRITGMVINAPMRDHTGIIRHAEDAVIHDLILEHHYVIGSDYTGGIIGEGESVVMENIQLNGDIRSAGGRWSQAGGIAGRADNSVFRHNLAHVTVTGTRRVGGLIGDFIDSEMYHSASYGHVWADVSNAGGLIGNSSGAGVITDCYSHADVEGERHVGGLIGNFQSGRIQNCLSTGRVTGTGDDVGGLLGSVFSATRMNISHCYWDETTTGQSESAGGEGVKGLSTSELMQRETYDGFNFHSLWQINDGSSYPSFQALSEYEIPEPASTDDLRGSGNSDSPWLISSPSELLAMADNVHGHYRLTADIDLESSAIWNYGRGWTPLAGTDEGERFTGVLDGDGHRITGMVINAPMRDHTGIIRHAEDAVIRDLILDNHYVIGSDYIGGIIGEGESVVMENIQMNGDIRSAGGRWSQAGGIAGKVDNSVFRHNLAHVTVTGTRRVGGLIGDFIDSEIYQSASYGHVWADVGNAGGLIGHSGGTSVVGDSYSHASVEGENHVGGLIGNFTWGDILNTYSIGQVTGSGDDVGGLIGSVFSASPEKSYWNTETSGQMQSAGGDGVMGRTTDEMTWPYAENTYEEWDFNQVWKHDSDGIANDGYPFIHERLTVTDAPVAETHIPSRVRLDQNYPNPFNPSTTIVYATVESGQVRLSVYDILGRRVALLVDEYRPAGEHSVHFHTRGLSSGVYLYRLQVGDAARTRKMQFLK
ncbi:T9SS type A sorting domain-containing protein [Balneolales bacterium ANBcel1]|nr:T9SS type A sorting domain-containing protein [Balneolales bacterium ANBcel1]